jgi:hypothetical protein
MAESGNAKTIRTGRHKLIRRQADPRETTNLIAEAGLKDLVEDLTEQLDRCFERYSHPERDGRRVGAQPLHNVKELWRVVPAFRE